MNKIIKEFYLNLNYHITSGSGLNMRCFEVLGNQSCLVSNGAELKIFKNNELFTIIMYMIVIEKLVF